VDPRLLSAERRFHEYAKATIAASSQEIRSEKDLRNEPPFRLLVRAASTALVVKEKIDAVGGTHPHRESGNSVVRIHQFLSAVLATLKGPLNHWTRARRGERNLP
jgi:hypothetical protein